MSCHFHLNFTSVDPKRSCTYNLPNLRGGSLWRSTVTTHSDNSSNSTLLAYTVQHQAKEVSTLGDFDQLNSPSSNDIPEHLPTPDPANMSKKPKSKDPLSVIMPLVFTQSHLLELLKCHCDHCHTTNYICETDGVCYFSWELVNNNYKYSKRYEMVRKLLKTLVSAKSWLQSW